MFTLQQCQEIFNTALLREVELLKKKPEELYLPVEYIMSSGGKRLRPSLVLMSFNLFSDDIESAVYPALGIEFFHNFTLLHDDIMDKSPMRRNNPTVHTKWNENVAILSGDAMAIIAYHYISKCRAEFLTSVLETFSQSALKVCEGQQYDMNFETLQDVSEADYLKMIELKTAVLIATSLKTGAILGGAKTQEANTLYDFGKNLGLAFQLQDDLLDVFGNSEVFGKPIGADIIANKKTYLMIKALSVARDNDLAELKQTLSNKYSGHAEKIKTITGLYHKLNIQKYTAGKIKCYYDNALQCLESVNSGARTKEYLRSVAEMLMHRER